MSSARVDYIAFQPTDNSFQPEEENYQQVSAGGPEQEVLTESMSDNLMLQGVNHRVCY